MPLFQFTNGIYNTDRCKLYPWVSAKDGRSAWEALIADGVHRKADCINSFDVECFADDVPYMDIPTPTLDRLVGHQIPLEHRAEVLPWIYCHLGRLMYPLRRHDNWQTLLCIYGPAGTGKSTLVDMVVSMFREDNVAFVSSQDHVTRQMYDKAVWMCLDVSEDSLPSSPYMEAMISGKRVDVSNVGDVPWRSPGLMCATGGVPPLREMYRYCYITPMCFNTPVEESRCDVGLGGALLREMGCIIPKLCSAYVAHARDSAVQPPAEPGLVRTWRNQITREAMSMAK
jgi:hypothetical protein